MLQVVVALSATPPAVAARPTPQAAFTAAVKLFQSFEDDKAAAAFRKILAHSPPASIAAKAHLYLGLIALNSFDSTTAKAEFVKAVATEVLVDLPPGQSPKAQILFAEARRDVASAPAVPSTFGPSTFSPSPFAGPPAEAGSSATVETTASHGKGTTVAAWVTGVIGVAALGTGIGFGVAQNNAKNQLPVSGSDPVTDAGQATSLAQAIPRDGLIADVLFGVGGAALVASLVLFLVPSGGSVDANSTASLSVSVGPAAVQVGGRW